MSAPETLFEELKRYVGFGDEDARALETLGPVLRPHFPDVTERFYARIFAHDGARQALIGGESRVGQLRQKLVEWLERLVTGPWDEPYFEARCRIGRVHVRIELPQHYMFGAMGFLRGELAGLLEQASMPAEARARASQALHRILDLELAIMLHTYREDLMQQRAREGQFSQLGQLVASIGHELRNPLSVIETSLYLLRKPSRTDDGQDKHLTRIGEQVRLSNNLISNLLDMIRDRPVRPELVDLIHVVNDAIANLVRPATATLELVALDALPPLQADASLLRQVFLNLLDNAFHAAGPSAHVRVSAEASSELLTVYIDDNGPGISMADWARLFQPLETTKKSGVGLGLPLVKRLIERHHGSVAYAPGPLGGARFIVRLPRDPLQPAAPALEPS